MTAHYSTTQPVIMSCLALPQCTTTDFCCNHSRHFVTIEETPYKEPSLLFSFSFQVNPSRRRKKEGETTLCQLLIYSSTHCVSRVFDIESLGHYRTWRQTCLQTQRCFSTVDKAELENSSVKDVEVDWIENTWRSRNDPKMK
ncbi:hypothetical protein HRR77_005019 [Exophiala dermatitidis]|nr:hypothetical protein HRR77_005019 [Exophiala dermatitidis]KAJ4570718.1 hypothetical protein HRR79_003657 [Exophiala dermatitidis]